MNLSASSAAIATIIGFAARTALADSSVTPALPPPATVPQAAPSPSAVPTPTPEELMHRRIVVDIESTRRNAVLERRVSVKEEVATFVVLPYKSTEATWEQVCVSPCSVDLDRFSTYRVAAQNGVSGSRAFTLPPGSDALHLKLDAGSLAVHRIGGVVATLGVTALIIGGGLLVVASDFRHPDDARLAGAVTGGAGLLFAAVGIPLGLATRTKVLSQVEGPLANVYWYQGHRVPFLPEVDLGHGYTLTQHGIVF